jgi:hypothetical protein
VTADDCIEWAYDMLECGFDTPNLLMLAAVNKPASYFDMEPYMLNAFKELGLSIVDDEEKGLYGIIYYYANKIAKGEDVKSNLSGIYHYGVGNYGDFVMDFLYLYYAWGDFDYGEKFSHYLNDVTPDNIEAMTIRNANNWLEKYESVALSLLP